MNSPCALNRTMKPAVQVVASQLAVAGRKVYGSPEARSARREELRAKLETRRAQAEAQVSVPTPALAPMLPAPVTVSVNKQRENEKVPALPVQAEALNTAFEKQSEKQERASLSTRLKSTSALIFAKSKEAMSIGKAYMQSRTALTGCAVGIGVALGLFAPEIVAAGLAVKLACAVGAGALASVVVHAFSHWPEFVVAAVRSAQAAPSGLVASGIASLACAALGFTGPAAFPIILGAGALGLFDGDSLVQNGMDCLQAAANVGLKATTLAGAVCLAATCGSYFAASTV